MITEEEKFKAETFRIFGIALLTPAGKVLLDPWQFFVEHNPIYCIFYILFALVFSVVGVIHIERARAILDQRDINKWKSPQKI